MSAPNFRTMRDFPLYVRDNRYGKVCPECGCTMGVEDAVCDECGADMAGVEATYDYDAEYLEIRELEIGMEKANANFQFHKIVLESGRYCGMQFFVERMFHGYDSLDDMDNDTCRGYYGECRSKVLRRYKTEIRAVRKALAEIASLYGYEEYVCVGIFSNGEAVYEKVDSKKGPTLRQKAKAAIAAA